MIHSLLDFITRMGTHHFLVLGIVILVLWLLISGVRKGLKKDPGNGGHEQNKTDNPGS